MNSIADLPPKYNLIYSTLLQLLYHHIHILPADVLALCLNHNADNRLCTPVSPSYNLKSPKILPKYIQ